MKMLIDSNIVTIIRILKELKSDENFNPRKWCLDSASLREVGITPGLKMCATGNPAVTPADLNTTQVVLTRVWRESTAKANNQPQISYSSAITSIRLGRDHAQWYGTNPLQTNNIYFTVFPSLSQPTAKEKKKHAEG